MDKSIIRAHLNQFKPYLRDPKRSVEDILDAIAVGIAALTGPDVIVNSNITINQTSDYDKFINITSNRDVDKKHIKKLIASIEKKNLLYIRPILVNELYEVIDGQHRLEACMVLQIPVPYMICPGLTKEDIHFLNTVQKNWTTMDFINYFTIENRKGFQDFSRLANQFPSVKASILLKLVSSSRNTQVREGMIDIGRLEQARVICHHLDHLNNFWKKKVAYQFVYSAAFATALQKCVRTPNFDFNRLYNQIGRNQDLFRKHTSRNEYLKLIHLIYNKDCEETLALTPADSLV